MKKNKDIVDNILKHLCKIEDNNMNERKFKIGDKVISELGSIGVIEELFDDGVYGVFFNNKILDAVHEDCLSPYDGEIPDQPKNLFVGVKFGDRFLTYGGKVAIFLHKNMNGDYRFGTDLETYSVDEDGRAWDGTVLNIVSKIEDSEEDLENELDTLRMQYLSQVSMWKSQYESEVKKNRDRWVSVKDKSVVLPSSKGDKLILVSDGKCVMTVSVKTFLNDVDSEFNQWLWWMEIPEVPNNEC